MAERFIPHCSYLRMGHGMSDLWRSHPILPSRDLWNLEAFPYADLSSALPILFVECGLIWESQIAAHLEVCWHSKCVSQWENKVQILENAFHYRICLQKGVENLQELQQIPKHLLKFFINRKFLWIYSLQHHSIDSTGESFSMNYFSTLN